MSDERHSYDNKPRKPSGQRAIAAFRHKKTDTEYAIFDEGRGWYAVYLVPTGREMRDSDNVANANLVDDGAGDYLTSVTVESEHRRRGVASALYRAIEHHTGRSLRPSPRHLSPDAEAFWQARKGRHH